MKFYIQTWLFAFQRYFAYPLELFFSIIEKIIVIVFLIVFWNIIQKSSPEALDIRSLSSYFLIASGISAITANHDTVMGRYIRRNVKAGSISGYLLLPVKIIPYMYALSSGKHAINFIYGIIAFFAGIIILPPTNIISVILFIPFFISAFWISFAFNLFEGSLSFVFEEVGGFKNALRHITRVMSGMLVPLSLFPETLRVIAYMTPFPYMIYFPSDALKMNALTTNELIPLFIAISWAIILMTLNLFFWKKVLKNYEAIGI